MTNREQNYIRQRKWLKLFGIKLHRYPKFYIANNNEIIEPISPCSGETVTVTIKAENHFTNKQQS